MGTHIRGPSRICRPPELAGKLLSDWLKTNQCALGEEVATRFNGQVPFLFKVLSINKALSIQAHPTKSHAEELHQKAPDLYKDSNHKPELVVALKDFEGLCGFRSFKEIVKFLKEVPELCAVAGEENCASMRQASGTDLEKAALKQVFSAVIKCEESTLQQQLQQLLHRARAGDPGKDCYNNR
jgi:mannose-6-phosphate isomerase